jgi:hypothetical protein
MFAILLHNILDWFDGAQRDRWESYLAAASDISQVEHRMRELEDTRSTF